MIIKGEQYEKHDQQGTQSPYDPATQDQRQGTLQDPK
jgi:hypothetical protein